MNRKQKKKKKQNVWEPGSRVVVRMRAQCYIFANKEVRINGEHW